MVRSVQPQHSTFARYGIQSTCTTQPSTHYYGIFHSTQGVKLKLELSLSKAKVCSSSGRDGVSVGVCLWLEEAMKGETASLRIPVKVKVSSQMASKPGKYTTFKGCVAKGVLSSMGKRCECHDYYTNETGPITSTSQLARHMVGAELRVRVTMTELDGSDLTLSPEGAGN